MPTWKMVQDTVFIKNSKVPTLGLLGWHFLVCVCAQKKKHDLFTAPFVDSLDQWFSTAACGPPDVPFRSVNS